MPAQASTNPKPPDPVLAHIAEQVGPPPRWFNLFTLRGTRRRRPKWLTNQDPMARIFAKRGQILRNGVIRWAHIVQANNMIFAPGDDDHGAQIVYAPGDDVSIEGLGEVAHRAFALKGTQPADPLELRIANMLTNELERALDWPVPKSLTRGRNVITSIIVLPRAEMPGRLLAM